MQTWMLIWKIVLIGAMILFASMAVWVTIWGAIDIKKLLQTINKEHQQNTDEPEQKAQD